MDKSTVTMIWNSLLPEERETLLRPIGSRVDTRLSCCGHLMYFHTAAWACIVCGCTDLVDLSKTNPDYEKHLLKGLQTIKEYYSNTGVV